MGEFSIIIQELKTKSDEMIDISLKLKKNTGKIIAIQRELLHHKSMDQVRTAVEKAANEVLVSSDCIHSCGSTLKEIVDYYEATEDWLISNEIKDFAPQMIANGEAQRSSSSVWKQIKILAEILGISIIEAVTLTRDLTELLQAGLWELATGWTDGNYDWQAWIYKYIPNYVDDKTLLAIFTLVSTIGIDTETRKEHFEKNISAWDKYRNNHSQDILSIRMR